MRNRLRLCRPAAIVTALCLSAGFASGDELVEVVDATSYVVYPTRWVVSDPVYTTTSEVVPMSSRTVLRPTTYAAPSYSYSPTYSYVPTQYVVEETTRPRGLLGGLFRPWDTVTQTRTYRDYEVVPTSYTTFVPTSTVQLGTPVISTTQVVRDPCATETATTPTSTSRPAGGASDRQKPAGASAGKPPTSLTSEPRSPQTPPAGAGQERTNGARPDEPSLDYNSIPRPEKPEGGASDASPAPAPGADELGIPGLNNTQHREALKPAATELSARTAPLAPSTLRGEVISAADQKPESNVRLVFKNRRQTFEDRVRLTDGLGRFEVLLPNGDWEVAVIEPDGQSKSYGIITSTGGQFFDERDRAVASLRLNH